VGRKRIERIMRRNGRKGAYLPRGWKHGSTRQDPRHTAAPDLLGRDFTATAPNQKWVADITPILATGGVLWRASVRDAFSNKVVGWDSGPRATTEHLGVQRRPARLSPVGPAITLGATRR
jgi:putative transposase